MARLARTQAERSAATRDALIRGAVRSLVTQGYARTSVRSIAAMSGVSPGALQHHFPTKEGLVVAALMDLFGEVSRRLEELNPVGDWEERAARIVQSLWEFYGGPRYVAAAEILIATREDPAMHAPVRESRVALGEAYERMWDRLMIGAALSATGRRTLLRFAIAMLRGLSLLKLHEPEAALYERELAWLAGMIARAAREGDEFLADGRIAGSPAGRPVERRALI